MTHVCANTRCRRPLGVDHVTMTTTVHLRRFCSVECIIDGFEAHREQIYAEAAARVAAEMAAESRPPAPTTPQRDHRSSEGEPR